MGSNVVRLETGLGIVPVTLERAGSGALTYGEMEQFVPPVEPFDAVDELVAALGAGPDQGGLPIEGYRNGPVHVYVEFPSEDAVAALKPDIGALERLGVYGINCFAGSGERWKTRMFGPALGVAEDPATGSAAGPLVVHLARHGRVPFGTEIEIVQGVEIGRRSVLRARVEGSAERIERVFVGGAAVIVARGEYSLE
jgi:trans-2,3-dihydro-3-hydroxyanthranilate isomerase